MLCNLFHVRGHFVRKPLSFEQSMVYTRELLFTQTQKSFGTHAGELLNYEGENCRLKGYVGYITLQSVYKSK